MIGINYLQVPVGAYYAAQQQAKKQEEFLSQKIFKATVPHSAPSISSALSSMHGTVALSDVRKTSSKQLRTQFNAKALNRQMLTQEAYLLVASLVAIVALTALAPFSLSMAGGAGILVGAYTGFHAYQSKQQANFEQMMGSWLTSPQALQQTEQEWCQRTIEIFGLSQNCCSTGLVIPLELPIEKYQYYCTLQEEIAKLIPNERDRPIIDLRLRGSETSENQPSFGIIGGVGPLSDAAILKLTVEQLREKGVLQKVKIDLYSSPPPRKEAKVHLIKNLLNYVRGIKKFLTRSKVPEFCITSNTAHLNLDRLQGWSGNKMVSLVEAVGDHIQQDPIHPKKVLVLGTIEGYQGKLYPNVLSKKGVDSCTLDESDSFALQEVIDVVKSGKNDERNIRRLLQLLEKGLKQAVESGTPVTHILLGCTELPLALALHGITNPSLAKDIQDLKEKYHLVDSEELFAKGIAERVCKMLVP